MSKTKLRFQFGDVLTPKEAAKYLSISKSYLLYLFRENKMPGTKIGHRTIRFKIEDLNDWLDKQDKP